jgi:hypothetical protein
VYTVNVTGLTDTALTGSVQTQDEKVTGIEILSETAPLNVDTTATVGYKVVNQYGEDVTKLTSLVASGAGAKAEVDGLGKVTLSTNGTPLKAGDKVVVTLINIETATSVTKTVTISAAAQATGVEFGTVWNKDNKSINEDTDLSKDLFYLPVTVKDQYGNAVTNLTKLNGTSSEVIVTNTNPTVITTGNFEVVKINNVDTVVLPITGVKDYKAAVGEATVTVIVKANGTNAQTTVKVTEALRTDVVNLQASSSMVVAGEDVYLPISVLDKDGKTITDIKVLTDTVKGVKVSSGNGTIVEKDGALFVKVAFGSVIENSPVTVVVQSSTNKIATQTFIPKAAATAKVVTGLTLTSQSLRPAGTLSVGYDKVKLEDQYGRVMTKENVAAALTAGYSIKASSGDNANVTLDGTTIRNTTDVIKVVAKAGVTTKVSENITFTLVAPTGDEIKASAFDAKFTIVPDTEFASYEVADLGTVYLADGDDIAAGYEKNIVVNAVTKDGGKVLLTAGSDFTVKSTVLTGLNDGKIDAADAADVNYGTASTATAKVTVTINGTGEELVKDVKFSNVAPKVTTAELVENGKATDYINGLEVDAVSSSTFAGGIAFNLDELEKLADIVVTDQYGVQVALDEATEKASFSGVETAAATLTLSKVSGDVTFSSNGTTAASVNEIAAGSVFNARVNLSGVAGTIVKVTAKQPFSKAAVDSKALSDATAEVVKAEGSKLQADVTSAQSLVTGLPTGSDKTGLQNRINAVQKEIDDAALLTNPTLAVWASNVDMEYQDNSVNPPKIYPANSIFQANVNFAGKTGADFKSAEVSLYNGTTLLATNTAKTTALLVVGNTSITALFGEGDASNTTDDPNWNIGAYTTKQAPTKAVFTLVDQNGVSHTVTTNLK